MGALASPRKPAVVLGSIKEKSALTRAPGTHHRGTRYWQGTVGSLRNSCFWARRRCRYGLNYVLIRLGHGTTKMVA